MAKIHYRVPCPGCGMLAHPRRFRSPYPIRFLGFTYEAAGRGRGRYNWFPVPDFPDRRECLVDMRDQMLRCVDMLDLEIDSLVPLRPSAPTAFQPVPVVPIFSTLPPRPQPALIARSLNPILS